MRVYDSGIHYCVHCGSLILQIFGHHVHPWGRGTPSDLTKKSPTQMETLPSHSVVIGSVGPCIMSA